MFVNVNVRHNNRRSRSNNNSVVLLETKKASNTRAEPLKELTSKISI